MDIGGSTSGSLKSTRIKLEVSKEKIKFHVAKENENKSDDQLSMIGQKTARNGKYFMI
jgi:hypothetical protein